MVDLAEFVWTFSAKIDYQTTAKIIFHLNHVTCHYTVLAGNYLLTEFAELCFVFKSACSGTCEQFGCIFFCWLLAEAHSEDMILD